MFKVHTGYDRNGKERNRYFATLELATAFCNAYARRRNIFLSIVQI